MKRKDLKIGTLYRIHATGSTHIGRLVALEGEPPDKPSEGAVASAKRLVALEIVDFPPSPPEWGLVGDYHWERGRFGPPKDATPIPEARKPRRDFRLQCVVSEWTDDTWTALHEQEKWDYEQRVLRQNDNVFTEPDDPHARDTAFSVAEKIRVPKDGPTWTHVLFDPTVSQWIVVGDLTNDGRVAVTSRNAFATYDDAECYADSVSASYCPVIAQTRPSRPSPEGKDGLWLLEAMRHIVARLETEISAS